MPLERSKTPVNGLKAIQAIFYTLGFENSYLSRLNTNKRKEEKLNKFIGVGRLTKDPDVRYTQGSQPMAVARYKLAIDRKVKRDNEPSADFIPCIAFGKPAEFAQKYLHQGIKIAIVGRIQTGSYKDREGRTIYTTDVIVEEQEFCEKKEQADAQAAEPPKEVAEGFMEIPDDIDDMELPFN